MKPKIGEVWILDWEDGTSPTKFRIDSIERYRVNVTWMSTAFYKKGGVFKDIGSPGVLGTQVFEGQAVRDETWEVKNTMSKYENIKL